ncbi:patatin-like phospholipase family protein [Clostridium oryzae]|uniref:PNPLA domain-containing protein n=1 Tax=Clostridium oryzae TaxID=1450648 RepID=A0A1V4I5X4_9CLOT|nr:patatin family protein [Clostridium oryzae]OPJ55363.1 hypothetical protein CLORY_44290 [Clostridium oryzae]
MSRIGLVLEGGGMRGLYTCGVLEYFMEKDIYFKYIIGVSAGACNAVSYISRQKGRNKKINMDYADDWRYMSFRNMLREKSFFGMNFIFDELPNKREPFDYKTYMEAECEFIVGTTNCRSGKPVYFKREELGEKFEALRASASLPLLAPITKYKNLELLDGGIADPIPIKKSIADGNEKNIIILTRNKDYRKAPMSFSKIIKYKYRRYPKLVNSMVNRYIIYNQTLDYIDEQERLGKAIVIRPSQPLNVSRIERNKQKLQALFDNGFEDAKNNFDNVITFISK